MTHGDPVLLDPSSTIPVRGRDRELWELRSFAERVPRGGGAIAVLGAAGSGKSTVLEMLARHARIAVERVTGGLGEVRTGVARATEATLLLLDDAHRLPDGEFEQILFTARRLAATPVGLVVSAGETAAPLLAGAGIDVMRLDPLDAGFARTIVRDAAPVPVAAPVLERIVAAGAGNPRALIDFTRSSAADELSGRRMLSDPLFLDLEARRRWRDRFAGLGESELCALALVAAEDGVSLESATAAARASGLVLPITECEQRGILIVCGKRVGFTGAVLRSTAYHDRLDAQRRAIHAALATAIRAPDCADRRAWHRALAASDEDEAVAAALEDTADLARRHRGPIAVADALERAAELSGNHRSASRRQTGAAKACWQAGWRRRAETLLVRAGPLPGDPEIRATAALVSGALALSGGHPDDAFGALILGADSAIDREPDLALDLIARATGIAWWNGRSDLAGKTAALAERAMRKDRYSTFVKDMAAAGRDIVGGRLEHLQSALTRVLAAGDTFDEPRRLIFACESAGVLGDDVAALRLLQRAVRLLRGPDSRSDAPFALELLAFVNAWQGRLDAA
jgi:hypothetical protein